MFVVDIITLSIIALFIYKGVRDGFIDTLSALVGIVLGLYVASWWYDETAFWLMRATGWGATFCRVLMFIIILVVVNLLVRWVVYLAERTLDSIARLPVIKSLNTILGGFCGFIIALAILGCVFYGVRRFGSGVVLNAVVHSTVAGYVMKGFSFIAPYLPHVVLTI